MKRKQRNNDSTLSLGLDQTQEDIEKVTDNRKVVVEDLLYIDDLEIIVYSVIAPMSSNVFISHTKKFQKLTTDFDPVNQVVTLEKLRAKDALDAGKGEEADLLTNYFQLLARLKGH